MENLSRNAKKLNKYSKENDINYAGPLSYRHLRIIAWVFMGMLMSSVIIGRMKFGFTKHLSDVFYGFGQLALPLFLVANFAKIIRSRQNYKRNLLFFGGCSLLMIGIAYIFVFRYSFTILSQGFNPELLPSTESLITTVININLTKFTFLNMFLDIFLCMLMWTFLTYKPKKYFQGKKIIFFRLFVLIPILYEIACVIVKIESLFNINLTIPWYVFPFITTKPPLMLLAFLLITLYLKNSKRLFLKYRGDEEMYNEYRQTKRDSLHFSAILSIIFIITVVLDLLVLLIVLKIKLNSGSGSYEDTLNVIMKTGIGRAASLITIIPVVMLFDYKKVHCDRNGDIYTAIGGIIFVVIAVAESVVSYISYH